MLLNNAKQNMFQEIKDHKKSLNMRLLYVGAPKLELLSEGLSQSTRQPISHSDITRSNNPQANEVAGTRLPGNRFELISSKKSVKIHIWLKNVTTDHPPDHHRRHDK